MPALTDMQEAFVHKLVTTGCTQTAAAAEAGYAQPDVSASQLVRKPHVAAAIREMRERVIGDLANVAVATLRTVMADTMAPASARVSAARTSLEAAGHLGKGVGADAGKDKPLHEMTQEQLTEFITKSNAAIASQARAAPVAVAG
jgi:hypothetical protein